MRDTVIPKLISVAALFTGATLLVSHELSIAADMLETVSGAQARGLKRKFVRQAGGLILACLAERQYARILPAKLELTRKYFRLSAKLKGKTGG